MTGDDQKKPEDRKFSHGVIVTSAILGSIVSAGTILNWLDIPLFPQKPVIDEAGIGIGVKGDSNGQPVVAPVPVDPLTELAADLSERVAEVLAGQRCRGVVIKDLVAEETHTPAEQSTSTFDTVVLTGEVALNAGDSVHRIRLAGSGKGPDAETRARSMAIEGFTKQLAQNEELARFCKGV